MLRDDVTCNNCDTRSTVALGADACPSCGMVGALRWTDEERPEIEAGMDWHVDTKGHACACIEEEHDDRPRISYQQARALDEWDRKTERTGLTMLYDVKIKAFGHDGGHIGFRNVASDVPHDEAARIIELAVRGPILRTPDERETVREALMLATEDEFDTESDEDRDDRIAVLQRVIARIDGGAA